MTIWECATGGGPWWVLLLAVTLAALPVSAEEPAVPPAQPAQAARPPLPPELLVLPTTELHPQAVLDNEFVNFVSKPFDDPLLEFQVTARKAWKWEKIEVRVKESEVDFLPIAMIHGPEAAGIDVTIQAGTRIVEREVAMEDYLQSYAEGLGYRILREQWGTYSDRQVYELLARTDFNGVDCLVRMALSRDHKRYFLVCGFCAASEYANFAKDLGVAVVSFKQLKPTGNPYSEEMVRQALSPTKVAFLFPRSWTAKPAASPPDGMAVCDLTHGSEEKGVAGWIRVKSVSRTTYPKAGAADHLAGLREELGDLGFTTDTAVFDGPVEPAKSFEAGGRFVIFPATRDGRLNEVRAVFLPTRDAWLVLTLLTPAHELGPIEWMINKRAFEIVRDTLATE